MGFVLCQPGRLVLVEQVGRRLGFETLLLVVGIVVEKLGFET